jgi:hypothetical protein
MQLHDIDNFQDWENRGFCLMLLDVIYPTIWKYGWGPLPYGDFFLV